MESPGSLPRALDDIDLVKLEQRLSTLKHVLSAHHTHVWSMDGVNHVLTTHVVVASQTDRDAPVQVRRDVAHLCKEYRLVHTTVEIEWGEDECRMGIG